MSNSASPVDETLDKFLEHLKLRATLIEDTKYTKEEADEAIKEAISARKSIIMDHPFYSIPVMQLSVRACGKRDILSGIIDGATDFKSIKLNPRGFLKNPPSMRKSVVAHEGLHCILMHDFRRGSRERVLWNYACDYVINSILKESGFTIGTKETVAKYGLDSWYEWAYDKAYDGMTTEDVYDILLEKYKKEKSKNKDLGEKYQSFKIDNMSDEDWEILLTMVNMLDIMPSSLGDGIDEENAPDAHELAAKWRNIAYNAIQAGKAADSIPGGIEDMIHLVNQPKVHWRSVLRSGVRKIIKDGYSYSKPNRRFISQGKYLPSREMPSLGRIIFATDTSGSVGNNLLSQMLSECAFVKRSFHCQVDILLFDMEAHLQGRYMYADTIPKKLDIIGRGGTGFECVFDWVEKNSRFGSEHEDIPTMLIFLTDCCGSYRKEPLRLNTRVVFVSSMDHKPGSTYYPPYGQFIYADLEND